MTKVILADDIVADINSPDSITGDGQDVGDEEKRT